MGAMSILEVAALHVALGGDGKGDIAAASFARGTVRSSPPLPLFHGLVGRPGADAEGEEEAEGDR
jgi:hypothetical protein